MVHTKSHKQSETRGQPLHPPAAEHQVEQSDGCGLHSSESHSPCSPLLSPEPDGKFELLSNEYFSKQW